MMYFWLCRSRPSSKSSQIASEVGLPTADDDYEPLLLVASGDVRRITLGSSPSGNADANSQYYW
jgi:hypothetical protein